MISDLTASCFADASGANQRVRIGAIGAGGRGKQLMDHLVAKPQDLV